MKKALRDSEGFLHSASSSVRQLERSFPAALALAAGGTRVRRRCRGLAVPVHSRRERVGAALTRDSSINV